MKKLTVLFVVIAIVFCSCGIRKENNDKMKVVTTIFPEYDFSRQIAGDNAEISLLVPPGTELHKFEPTPKDIISIQSSDVFIYVGGESDAWVDKILESSELKNTRIIKLMEIVTLENEGISEGMEDASGESEYDEHVWTSPVNAVKIINCISNVFCEKDGKNAEIYAKNAKEYVSELEKIDAEFKNTVSEGRRKTIVFADRFPLTYFANEYNLNYYAAFKGCSEETEPSAATVSFIINKVKKEKIPVVFKIELSNGKMAKTVSEETGAKILEFNSCHNITKKQFDSGVTYLELMKNNLSALKEALN